MLLDEFVSAVEEYAKDSLMVACIKTKNLFNFRNLQPAIEIIADDVLNDDKQWLGPFKGIDGFLLCAGKNAIQLVSLEESKMETLIN